MFFVVISSIKTAFEPHILIVKIKVDEVVLKSKTLWFRFLFMLNKYLI